MTVQVTLQNCKIFQHQLQSFTWSKRQILPSNSTLLDTVEKITNTLGLVLYTKVYVQPLACRRDSHGQKYSNFGIVQINSMLDTNSITLVVQWDLLSWECRRKDCLITVKVIFTQKNCIPLHKCIVAQISSLPSSDPLWLDLLSQKSSQNIKIINYP